MLKKVVYVALLVSDQDKALDFYTNVIGLEKRIDSPTPAGPRFLTVGVKGQDFEFVLWPGTPARADLGAAVYTIEVEDLRTEFETLKSHGVTVRATRDPRVPMGFRREIPGSRRESASDSRGYRGVSALKERRPSRPRTADAAARSRPGHPR